MTREEDLQNILEELREDITLLDLALLGSRASINGDILNCLLRLAGYLRQHIDDVCVLCR